MQASGAELLAFPASFKNHTTLVQVCAPLTSKLKLLSKWTEAIHLPTKYQLFGAAQPTLDTSEKNKGQCN